MPSPVVRSVEAWNPTIRTSKSRKFRNRLTVFRPQRGAMRALQCGLNQVARQAVDSRERFQRASVQSPDLV
jgi:hypothetical protein